MLVIKCYNRRIGHIICRVTYGYSVQSADDPFLTGPIAAMANFSKATTPGNFLVDFIPARKSYYSFIIIIIPVFTHTLLQLNTFLAGCQGPDFWSWPMNGIRWCGMQLMIHSSGAKTTWYTSFLFLAVQNNIDCYIGHGKNSHAKPLWNPYRRKRWENVERRGNGAIMGCI